MKTDKQILMLLLMLMLTFTVSPFVQAEAINDDDSLSGYRSGKIIFDINLSDPQKTILYLDVIRQTALELEKNNIKPDIVLAFRGLAVKLIQKEIPSPTAEQQELYAKISQGINELQKLGVKMEACSVATNLFKVDNNNILPGIKVVGNTFVSLMGYQQQGYAIIPIM